MLMSNLFGGDNQQTNTLPVSGSAPKNKNKNNNLGGLGSLISPTAPPQTVPGNAPAAFGPEVQQLSQVQNLLGQLQNPQQRMSLAQILAQQFAPPPAGQQGFGQMPLPGQRPPLGEVGGFPVSPQGQPQMNMGNPMSNILQYLASQGRGY